MVLLVAVRMYSRSTCPVGSLLILPAFGTVRIFAGSKPLTLGSTGPIKGRLASIELGGRPGVLLPMLASGISGRLMIAGAASTGFGPIDKATRLLASPATPILPPKNIRRDTRR